VKRAAAPHSLHPQATLAHLRDMGVVVISGDRALVAHRSGLRTEWRRQLGSEWFERIDADAPIAAEQQPNLDDPREAPAANTAGPAATEPF